MKKLLFQSDDYGISNAVTDGILYGIEHGIIRNTGLFVNMPSSERAANLIRPYLDKIALGIDINLVAGYSVTDPKLVPHLVNADGHMIPSTQRYKECKIIGRKGICVEFEVDPYPFEEVLLETESQILKFKELVGRLPDYFHGHSLSTPNTDKAAKIIAEKYGIQRSFDLMRSGIVYPIPCTWTPKPFPLEDQKNTNVVDNFCQSLSNSLSHEIGHFTCHCGYVDSDLLNETTYTLIRTRDLQAATSNKVKQFLKDNGIELITYKDLRG